MFSCIAIVLRRLWSICISIIYKNDIINLKDNFFRNSNYYAKQNESMDRLLLCDERS